MAKPWSAQYRGCHGDGNEHRYIFGKPGNPQKYGGGVKQPEP